MCKMNIQMNVLFQSYSPNGESEMRTVSPCLSLHHVCSIEMYCNELTPPSFAFQMRISFWFCDLSLCPPNAHTQAISTTFFSSSSPPIIFLSIISRIRNALVHPLGVSPLPLKIHKICYTNVPQDIPPGSSNQRIILFPKHKPRVRGL